MHDNWQQKTHTNVTTFLAVRTNIDMSTCYFEAGSIHKTDQNQGVKIKSFIILDHK